MATDKQIAANRRNALKSTGPRTPEGKARSSQNGVHHDLSNRHFILASECPNAFEKFLHAFYEEHRPSTPTEITLVDTMAVARWRLMRLAGFEAAVIDSEDSPVEPMPSLDPATVAVAVRASLSYRRAADSGRSIETMSRSEARLQHQFNSALDRLIRLRKAAA